MSSPTVEVEVVDIVADPAIQIRKSNREPAIQRYMESFDHLPPVTVFLLPDGKRLLADGFHRLAAARRLGRPLMHVHQIEGTREEALEYAVLANARSAEPLTAEERDDGIRRLRQLHPDQSERQVAAVMGVNQSTVNRVFAADAVRRHVLWRPAARIPDSILAVVARAPTEQWEALLKAADRRGWTRDTLAQAVQAVKDDAVPGEHKRALLAAQIDPGQTPPAPVLPVDFQAPRPAATLPGATAVPLERSPRDPVGDDVGERLSPIRVEISISYPWESDRPRMRGIRSYQREAEEVSRHYELVVNRDGLEGLGDPRNPRESKGLVMVLNQIQQYLWRRIPREGWPVQTWWPDQEAAR